LAECDPDEERDHMEHAPEYIPPLPRPLATWPLAPSPDRSLLSAVPVVEPRLRVVRVAPHLPEALAIFREEFDLADPLCAFPCVQLGRDHAARAAVLARQRLALTRMH